MPAGALRNPLLAVAALVPLVQAPAGRPEELRSPRLRALSERLEATAVQAFWDERRAAGGPLIEPSAKPGHRLVTFVFRSAAPRDVRLDSNLNVILGNGIQADPDRLGRMSRLPDSDVHYLLGDAVSRDRPAAPRPSGRR